MIHQLTWIFYVRSCQPRIIQLFNECHSTVVYQTLSSSLLERLLIDCVSNWVNFDLILAHFLNLSKKKKWFVRNGDGRISQEIKKKTFLFGIHKNTDKDRAVLCTYPNILWSSTFVHRLIFPFSRLAASPLGIRWPIYCSNDINKPSFFFLAPTVAKSKFSLFCKIRNCTESKISSIYLWLRNAPVMWTSPSDDEQVFPSYFMATAAAIAALCCSIVPPLSKIRILFRAAIGQPDALKLTNSIVHCINHVLI